MIQTTKSTLTRNSASLRSDASATRLPTLPKDTPIASVENGKDAALNSKEARRRYMRYAEGSEKWFIGPMPVQKFLNEFLPREEDTGLKMPSPNRAFNKIPTRPKSKQEISNALIAAINEYGRCPSLKLFDTTDTPEVTGSEVANPNLCAYEEKEQNIAKREHKKVSANLDVAEFFVQVEALAFLNPFADPHPNLGRNKRAGHRFIADFEDEAGQDRARHFLYQNVAYAAEACARQHRTFYFSVSIFGTHARFIRWDRAGAIVTQSFDYRRNPQYLCDFVWRFGRASSKQRGYDPSVVVASEAEEKLFRKTIIGSVAFLLDIKDASKLAKAVDRHYEPGRVAKVDVYNEAQRSFDQYLVSRPVKSLARLTGRSTRDYWAVRLGSDKEIAFLRDTWRLDETDTEMEGLVYRNLKERGVTNICDVHYHGDVPADIGGLHKKPEVQNLQGEVAKVQKEKESPSSGPRNQSAASSICGGLPLPAQCTRTNEFIHADWACGELKVVKHTHYRLVLKEVGYPLEEFTGTRELIDATNDAFEALKNTIGQRDMLRCDVSISNIILLRDGKTGHRRGFLVDWDLSTPAHTIGKAEDQPRSGTWAYMFGEALNDKHDFRHSNADDTESMPYVRRVLWRPMVEDLRRWIHDFFDSYTFSIAAFASESSNVITRTS